MKEVDQWEKSCPLCSEANQCAIAEGGAPDSCWCRSVTISAKALSSIPPESVGRRCLCAACGSVKGGPSSEG